jgi:PAS domain S-box-containing protein
MKMTPALRILVVEDYEPFRQLICSSLRERDFRVIETSDGLEAVEKAQELQPDLVLFDICLPRLNGIESAKQVRSLVPNAKVMFVTQESSSEVIQETLRLGAQGYVHKQHAMTDLFPAIDAVLGGQRFVSSTLGFSDGTDVEYQIDLTKFEEDRLRYAAILESLDDAVMSVDMDGTISSWNSAACRMFGYEKKEAIGQQIAIIVPPELRHGENEILRRLRDGKRIDHYEAQRVTKSGKIIDVSITASLVRDAAGRIIGASGFIRDISERKRAEASLRERDERFRLAMNNVPSGVYTLDLQGVVTYVNPVAEAMFGWTTAELLGRKLHDVTHYMHPDGTPFPASQCSVLQILQKGIELREHEDVFIRKDGSFFPVVFTASPLKKDSETVGIVVGFRDDTLRRQAEQIVRESEERFRLVANTAPVMIWMSGLDKLFTYFNDPWLQFTGRSQGEERGNGWAEGVYPEDLPNCMSTYIGAFNQRKPFQMEYRLRRYDGEYRWIFDSGVPRFDTDGTFAGYIGSAMDVTERKLAETALSVMSQRLIQAHEEERRWIARELHDDISQRMASLILNLSGLKAQAIKSEVQKGIAKAIRESVEIGKELRALSHRLHSSNLEYLGLVAAASAYCRERSTEHKIEVDFYSEDIPKDLPQEVSLCLFRVLQESLQNAIKYSGSRRFQVLLKRGAGEIELTVRDFGVGFEPEYALKGHGLGLTSMRERLKLVNGAISIASQLGRGTTIQARVPCPVA